MGVDGQAIVSYGKIWVKWVTCYWLYMQQAIRKIMSREKTVDDDGSNDHADDENYITHAQ